MLIEHHHIFWMDRLCCRIVRQLCTRLQSTVRKLVSWPYWRLAVTPTSSRYSRELTQSPAVNNPFH